jgi:XTP/dITP diphosphohydrolase
MLFAGNIVHAATTNAGKLRDFAAATDAFGAQIVPLPGLSELAEPVEDGITFEANARIKAEYYSRHASGLWVLADDSGLEVDALDGMPGVRSARFAADEGFAGNPSMTPDERNNACLQAKLGGAESTARYRCVLALAQGGITIATAHGTVEGVLLQQPRGSGGFGYDPLFYLPEWHKTMAEIDLVTKQRISHRGMALRILLQNMELNLRAAKMKL